LENLTGRDYLENLGVNVKIIFEMDIRETEWEGVDWINVVQNREQ
jgi:hypothetical protein